MSAQLIQTDISLEFRIGLEDEALIAECCAKC